MTPEQRSALILDYMDGALNDALLCGKYGINQQQLETAMHIGTGNIINPEPIKRGLKRGMRDTGAVTVLAHRYLSPEDMAASPLDAAEMLQPDQRDLALHLNVAELSFANNVLRGMNATAAAAASFEIFNKDLADKKAAELLRTSHIAEYMASMRGRSLYAPLRNKAYMEAVLWQVIDRCMELKQSYDTGGEAIIGQCEFNVKGVVSAATLLAKIKGWEKAEENSGQAETQRDRLRRLQAAYVEGSKLDV